MLDVGWLLPLAGGVIGIAIGAAARLERFCTLAALERYWYAGDSSGLRTWVGSLKADGVINWLLRKISLGDAAKYIGGRCNQSDEEEQESFHAMILSPAFQIGNVAWYAVPLREWCGSTTGF